MRRAVLLIIPLGLLVSVGCAAPGKYHWGSYEEKLYATYTNPEAQKAFVEHLSEIVVEAEERGKKVPPGVFAEYGFAMYRAGKFDQAAVYFRREAAAWPQSAELMNRLLDAVVGREGGADENKSSDETRPPTPGETERGASTELPSRPEGGSK